ncbi:hypothetical protein AVEN_132087-1 [Araneus ventricosus]|uniref:Uncharacterized protein n=1 Tax=Araneus ventricosus TaxID=182803 RepID=A0A4Y2F8Q4_ARAVE|nr:hypothetical protein AVEN_132087-1 [Araneus ventricosus]
MGDHSRWFFEASYHDNNPRPTTCPLGLRVYKDGKQVTDIRREKTRPSPSLRFVEGGRLRVYTLWVPGRIGPAETHTFSLIISEDVLFSLFYKCKFCLLLAD